MEVGFENGSIVLDQSRGIYYTGQVVTGNVNFRLERLVTIAGINIQFLGEAKVYWTEQETQKRHGRTFDTQIQYKSEEQYFNIVQCLYGGQGNITQLNAGPHSLPFQFPIPPTVPSSFRGDKGNVSYEITAYMDFPGQRRETLKKFFTVISLIDLNKEDPEIAESLTVEFREAYSCFCSCNPSPVSIDVSLPVSGFCPGQVVPVTVDVKNKASVEVKKIVVQFVTRTRYHSRQPPASFSTPEEVMASASTRPVLSNMERHYTCELQIPDMIAPNLNNCSIMDVGYFFKVMINMSGCNDDLEDTSEILIGQIPLANFNNGYVHPMEHSLPSGPVPEFTNIGVPGFTNTEPIVNNQVNNVNAYPGFQPQPSGVPSAPPLDAGFSNSAPNGYEIGFKLPGQ